MWWYVQRSESEDGVVIAFHHVGPRCWAHVRLDSRIPYLLSRRTDCLERPSCATKRNLRKQKSVLPTWTTWDKERADFPKFSSDLSHECHGIHVPPCMHTATNKCDFKEQTRRLERWLYSQDHLLFFQSLQAWVAACTYMAAHHPQWLQL